MQTLPSRKQTSLVPLHRYSACSPNPTVQFNTVERIKGMCGGPPLVGFCVCYPVGGSDIAMPLWPE